MDPRKRIIALLAALATAAAVWGLAKVATRPSMSLLYAGLDAATAGGVIASLEQKGVAFEVRGAGIYVPEGARDRARMALAAEGLPANGAGGYELLDGLSGFGTTAEMFDATYWRAKEGELARTILASPNVRLARVHIANPVRRPFERGARPSASVIVSMGAGALGSAQAQAIRYLVASAVAGLAPEQVAVIDAENGVALRTGEGDSAAAGAEAPAARAAAMRANIERLLAARVGQGKAIVEVNVDTDMDSETITERVLDPQSRVAIHSETEENSENAKGAGAGGVTVASNLPDGDVEGGEGSSSRQSQQSRERVNYEVSEIRRERVRRPGQVRRISVAVLVDGVVSIGPDGAQTWSPRPQEELESLRELVRSAIGFDEARGDVVTIESLEFSSPSGEGAVAAAGPMNLLAMNAVTLIQLGVLALVALALGLFVLRPLLLGAGRAEIPAPEAPMAIGGPPGEGFGQAGVEEAAIVEEIGRISNGPGAEDRFGRLRAAIEGRAEETAEVLGLWLESPDAAAQPAAAEAAARAGAT